MFANIRLRDDIPPKEGISIFHLIVWVFVKIQELTSDQKDTIRGFYGRSDEQFNPVPQNFEELELTIRVIKNKNKNCVMKIVVAEKQALEMLNHIDLDSKRTYIYLYPSGSSRRDLDAIRQRLGKQEQRGMRRGGIADQYYCFTRINSGLDEMIKRAGQQTEKFTKSVRTFNNSMCLAGNFAEKANRYRYRLISCIHQQPSDFQKNYELFYEFAQKELPQYNNNQKEMQRNYIETNKLFSSFNQYKIAAVQFIQNQKNNPKKYNKRQFYEKMISLYQKEGVLYQFINNGLRTVSEENSNWQVLALPFSHLYKAIQQLSKAEIDRQLLSQSDSDKLYTKDFTVYRGGRIRKNELKQYQRQGEGVFIEFYGFMSTSLSFKIVADYFLSFDKPNQDENCVFIIKCKYDPRILEQKYHLLRHGFYMFKNDGDHNQEQQVLFNSLNIFKLIRIKKQKIKSLFSKEQLLAMQEKQEAELRFSNRTNINQTLDKYYNTQVTVVELQYGTFFDTLLEQSINLEERDAIVKENYVSCINKIKKCENFDFSDAYQLTNEPVKAYQYLKDKMNSKLDEKQNIINPEETKIQYVKLSNVCNKLGKVKQGLLSAKIAIRCYKQLQKVHLNDIFNKHYDTLCEMKMKVISIYMENGHFMKAEETLKGQLKYIQSKRFKQPRAKLRQTQVKINLALVYFQKGQLRESMDLLKQCHLDIQAVLSLYSLSETQIRCYCFKYLSNIFCSSERICDYSKFGAHLRSQMKEEITQRYGGQQEYKETFKMVDDLIAMAREVLKTQKKHFRSQSEFEDLLFNFNDQANDLKDKNIAQKTTEETIEENLKDIINSLEGQNIGTDKYKQLQKKFKQKYQQLRSAGNLRIEEEKEQRQSSNYIKRFLERQKKRRLQHIQKGRETFLKKGQMKLVERYKYQTKKIEQQIDKLKLQGYSDSAVAVLKYKNLKAKLLSESFNNDLAQQQIKKIIKTARQYGEERHYELGQVYLTQGKIQLQIEREQEAIQSFQEAERYFALAVQYNEPDSQDEDDDQPDRDNRQKRLIQNARLVIPQTSESERPLQNREQIKSNALNHNNSYLQSKLLQAKSYLLSIQKNERQRRLTASNRRLNQNSHQRLAQMKKAKKIIKDTQKIIDKRNQIQNLDNLSIYLAIIKGNYLIREPSQQNLVAGMKYLKKSFKMCDQKYGLNSSVVFITCYEVISRLYDNPRVLKSIEDNHLIDIISSAESVFKGCDFYWQIYHAQYLMESFRKNGEKNRANEYLTKAIHYLEQISRDKLMEERLQEMRNVLNRQNISDIQREARRPIIIPPRSRRLIEVSEQQSQFDDVEKQQQVKLKNSASSPPVLRSGRERIGLLPRQYRQSINPETSNTKTNQRMQSKQRETVQTDFDIAENISSVTLIQRKKAKRSQI